MLKSLLVLLLPPAAILAVLAASLAALCAAPNQAAQPLVCRTVNGNTVCAGPGSLSCQTVNGKTVCAQSGPSCRTGRGKEGCDSDLPIRKQRDDMSADDPDDDEDSGALDLPDRPAGPATGRRL
jgi:hypothetical protein